LYQWLPFWLGLEWAVVALPQLVEELWPELPVCLEFQEVVYSKALPHWDFLPKFISPPWRMSWVLKEL
jgi:hypothetical protein